MHGLVSPSRCWTVRQNIFKTTKSLFFFFHGHSLPLLSFWNSPYVSSVPLSWFRRALNLPTYKDKSYWRWEIYKITFFFIKTSVRCSQATCKAFLSLPDQPYQWPAQLFQLTTKWLSVDSSAPLFNLISKTCVLKSNESITNRALMFRSRGSGTKYTYEQCCLNKVLVIDNLWHAYMSNNISQHRFRSGIPFFLITPLQVSLSFLTLALKPLIVLQGQEVVPWIPHPAILCICTTNSRRRETTQIWKSGIRNLVWMSGHLYLPCTFPSHTHYPRLFPHQQCGISCSQTQYPLSVTCLPPDLHCL